MDSAPAGVALLINGRGTDAPSRPNLTLLDFLRDELGLTGAKKGCDMGNCGACTVLVDGRAVYACLTLAIDCSGAAIETIEALDAAGELHPIQRAFIEADAFQCGFCTPGQVMSIKGLLNRTEHPSEDDVIEALSGNLCRCGAYRNLLRAGCLAAGLDVTEIGAAVDGDRGA